jgi:hypothetical protein
VTVSSQVQVFVTPHRNDLAHSGESLKETILTQANVDPHQFGKLFSLPVDGQVYPQPLYLTSLTISGKRHYVVFVATEHDSVYAFDADSGSAIRLWQVSVTGAGETTASVSDVLNCTSIPPEVGITGTPVVGPGELGILGGLAAWCMGIPLVVSCKRSRFVKLNCEIVRRTALVHALLSPYIKNCVLAGLCAILAAPVEGGGPAAARSTHVRAGYGFQASPDPRPDCPHPPLQPGLHLLQ